MPDPVGAPDDAKTAFQLGYYHALELAQFRGGFLARTSHELRSPLNKVISLQQMILEELCDNPAEEREFVAEAYAASLKLLEYLDFLTHISKIDAGRLQPDLQEIALAPVFQQVQSLTELQAANRNLKLTVEVPDEAVHVWADAGWLQNTLVTLIGLAIDDSDRGTIRLDCDASRSPDIAYIWLESDCPIIHWKEPVSLPGVPPFDLEDTLSDSLRMGMVEATLRAMGGQLLLAPVAEPAAATTSRLECAVPKCSGYSR